MVHLNDGLFDFIALEFFTRVCSISVPNFSTSLNKWSINMCTGMFS